MSLNRISGITYPPSRDFEILSTHVLKYRSRKGENISSSTHNNFFYDKIKLLKKLGITIKRLLQKYDRDIAANIISYIIISLVI